MAFTIVRNDVNYYSPSTRCVAHLSLPSRPRIVRCHFLVALTYTFLLFSTINIHLQINGRLITVFTDMNESVVHRGKSGPILCAHGPCVRK